MEAQRGMAEAAEEEKEAAALSLQRQQERTPNENPSMCIPKKPMRSRTLAQQIRIILTPVAATKGEHNRHLPQKRLLEQFSSCEESLGKEPKAKKACNHPSSPQTRAVMSEASPRPAEEVFNTESQICGSVVAAVSSNLEEDGDPKSDRKNDNASTRLSAYERKRLKNITENAKFFASLKLFESAARLREMTVRGQSQRIQRNSRWHTWFFTTSFNQVKFIVTIIDPYSKLHWILQYIIHRIKPSKAKVETACRRSMRLQKIDPLGAPLPETQSQPEPAVEEHPRLPPGPLQMIPTDQDKENEVTEGFLNVWAKISQVKPNTIEKPTCDLESYKASLHKMVLQEDSVAKVVQNRIHSVAIHPSESRSLVAAGDKWGQIGLWDLDCRQEDGVHVFSPHSRPVSCMYFSPSDPAHLLSLSHDGTLRCGDLTRAVFDEVYRNEEYHLSAFDFSTVDASTLIVAMWDGEVAVVDRRTPGTSSELSAKLNSKTTRTVHVHPVNRHYFIAAGAENVAIYDARHLEKSGGKPVVSLTGHTKSVASAYFSPVTGNRVLTTCADDTLRIFGTKCISSLAPVLTTIRHNNYTGRWLTKFRAVWDPKRDDCFVVGSMSRPRQIEAFHATGQLLHSFINEDCLGSVCSINAWHPTSCGQCN
ncbi:WD repeat-containing protein 76 isoform X2 [Rhineura floridana]|uniref:WD repeat-containing protein 76 isoform X2 n=1 Tax=Rhineura floridana TaxID=261503 RepID=UPI002AC81CED|nr:WD repeat-containing protein 76 isoform X2 [Rhineura floridana]